MRDSLQPGLTHETRLEVTDDLTVPEVSPRLTAFADMPRVFATAYMVGLAEAACVECLAEHLEPGSATVGVGIDLSHTAPTLPGMTVTATATLAAIDGPFLTFDIRMEDDAGPIGAGVHRRALVERAKFQERAAARKAG